MWKSQHPCSPPILNCFNSSVVRMLTSHQYVLGSIHRPGVTCGLSLLLVVVPAPRGFFPGSPVFLPPQKSTFLNSNSIWKQWMKSHPVEIPLQIPIISYLNVCVVVLLKAVFTLQLLFIHCQKYKNCMFTLKQSVAKTLSSLRLKPASTSSSFLSSLSAGSICTQKEETNHKRKQDTPPT